MNLTEVYFSKLKNTSKDTIGWIQVNVMNINYPFIQTTNNDYYLNHSLDKSYNSSGWLFINYRNNISTFNNYTLYTLMVG